MERSTGVTPKALLDRPILYGICMEIGHAYNVLSARRTVGLAANPIPLSEINAYITIYGPLSIPIDLFIDLLGAMDLKYLELTNGKLTGNR